MALLVLYRGIPKENGMGCSFSPVNTKGRN